MCENEIKKGSTVILKCNIGCFLECKIPEGTKGFVLENALCPFVEFDIKPNKFLHDGGGLGEEGKCWSVHINYLKLYEYKTSNRYKLHQAIKATGFHAEKLSLATGFKKGYFSDYTSESRFNSRGDITEERLNSLLTTLAFAERELLGVGAKTVDDNPIIDKTSQSDTDNEIDEDLKESIEDSEIKDQTKLYSEYFDSANKRIQQKKDAKVRNFLIVFLVFVVILSIYFLTR